MENQTFGIEIELYNAPDRVVEKAIMSVVGGERHRKRNIHGIMQDGVLAADGRFWAVSADSSIGGTNTNELVSPILKWEDLETVQRIVRALRVEGCKSDPLHKCGIHIHVGKKMFSPRGVVNLINIIATRQKLLYKALEVDTNRLQYCAELGETFVALVESKRPRDFEGLRDLWYRAFPDDDHSQLAHYHKSRYQGINLHSLFSGDTVEFRLFNGTLHAGLVRTYVLLVLALSAQAQKLKSSRSDRRVVAIENEKYSMRCWLLRLGFVGDYFKNPRFHLLENLSGDSAWRYPESRATGVSPMVARARSLD